MTARHTVLVVDDDPDVRASIAEALEEEDIGVHVAQDGREALAMLRQQGIRPSVILLDMMMPEMDGWAFRAEQLKEPALAGIPVLIFSAYSLPDDADVQLAAAGYLKKPLTLVDLNLALQALFGTETRVG